MSTVSTATTAAVASATPPLMEPASAVAPVALGRIHGRRLREIYRSAGWPCQDLIELELLAAGLVGRVDDGAGHATLRVTDAGIAHLALSLAGNRAAFSAHHGLESRVAAEMQRAGRIVWRGLCLRARLPGTAPMAASPVVADAPATPAAAGTLAGFFAAAFSEEEEEEREARAAGAPHRWCLAKPDVYSIRNTSVEAYVHPVVHEIKVRRADLLGDLKKPDKRAAYLDMASECWYVLGTDGRGRPIADASEIPLECGVLVEEGGRLRVARPAPRRAMTLRFDVWLALAKASPLRFEQDNPQASLAPCDQPVGPAAGMAASSRGEADVPAGRATDLANEAAAD